MARVLVGVVVAIVFAVALVLATLREVQVECEVCVAFGGEELCRTSSASDRGQALAMAQSTACALLSNGVTAGIQCQRVTPHSVRCDGP